MKTTACTTQMVLCGRGGQGVLFATRLIDEVAVAAGHNVISSETHGMAMRGGSVISCIRIGRYASPFIRSGQADIMLALSEDEAQMYRHLLNRSSGIAFVNAAGRRRGCVDATKLARDSGSALAANLVLLGFAAAHALFPFACVDIVVVLERLSPERHRQSNLRALAAGHEAGSALQQIKER